MRAGQTKRERARGGESKRPCVQRRGEAIIKRKKNTQAKKTNNTNNTKAGKREYTTEEQNDRSKMRGAQAHEGKERGVHAEVKGTTTAKILNKW